MKRSLIVGTAVLATLLMGSTAALADSPHLIGSPSTTVSGNSITFSASVAGLGNANTATFDWDGTINVSSRCYTKSQNKPQAANKQEAINVDTETTSAVRNGRTNASLTVAPLSTLSCPPGQHVVVESVTYDITLSYMGDVLATFTS
jgi:hypothetical protein